MPLFRPRAASTESSRLTVIENLCVVEDEVDAAVPVDAKDAPTRDLEHCTDRSVPQRPPRSCSFEEDRGTKRAGKVTTTRIKSNVWDS
jgi:hypothetical protein